MADGAGDAQLVLQDLWNDGMKGGAEVDELHPGASSPPLPSAGGGSVQRGAPRCQPPLSSPFPRQQTGGGVETRWQGGSDAPRRDTS